MGLPDVRGSLFLGHVGAPRERPPDAPLGCPDLVAILPTHPRTDLLSVAGCLTGMFLRSFECGSIPGCPFIDLVHR